MKDKKDNGDELNMDFTLKGGKFQSKKTDKTLAKESIDRAKRCSKPFGMLTDALMSTISGFLEANKDNDDIDGKELTMLVVGALAFVTGHFFSFLKSHGVASDINQFCKEFELQIKAASKMMEDKEG